ITSWRQFQGKFSAMDSGVCPKSWRNFFEGCFFRLWISPLSTTTSCSYVSPLIWMEPNEKLLKCMVKHPLECWPASPCIAFENAARHYSNCKVFSMPYLQSCKQSSKELVLLPSLLVFNC